MRAGVCARLIPRHDRSILLWRGAGLSGEGHSYPAVTVGVGLRDDWCHWRLHEATAWGWQLSSSGQESGAEVVREIQEILGGGLQSGDKSSCLEGRLGWYKPLSGWGQVCLSSPLLSSPLRNCYASLPPLPFWAWGKLFTRCPAVQPRAGPGRLFSITQIKSTLFLPATQPYTLQEERRRHKEAHGLPSRSPECR